MKAPIHPYIQSVLSSPEKEEALIERIKEALANNRESLEVPYQDQVFLFRTKDLKKVFHVNVA